MGHTINVYYDDHQSLPENIQVISPSAAKPAKLVDRWLCTNKNIKIVKFDPVTTDDFYLVHQREYIDGVLSTRMANGFGTKHSEVAATLPWTTGSFVAAALDAFTLKTITCSPTSGFHHAEWARAMGFCTFNGLLVAAIKLHNIDPSIKIGILDCDHHYGNGTDNIIAKLGINYITHYTFGGQEEDHYNWGGGYNAEHWLTKLANLLLKEFINCHIVLYQAGADAHADDPCGGALSTEQLARRDDIVFDFFSSKRIPVAWNLAGGYQTPLEKVLVIHDNTLDAALRHVSRY
ncbi:histone deacetylase [Candidatus Parcubacteria bacterium]|nr:MAG: histone deacetylase [Candidatus Parcubacteria bacterium]